MVREDFDPAGYGEDYLEVKEGEVEQLMRGVPNLSGVVELGGSPCQGISQLSSERLGLADERSCLFFELLCDFSCPVPKVDQRSCPESPDYDAVM